jgi:hypothetical protein
VHLGDRHAVPKVKRRIEHGRAQKLLLRSFARLLVPANLLNGRMQQLPGEAHQPGNPIVIHEYFRQRSLQVALGNRVRAAHETERIVEPGVVLFVLRCAVVSHGRAVI